MKFFTFLAAAFLALTVGFADAVSPAYAGVNCSNKLTTKTVGDKSYAEAGTTFFTKKPWSRTAEDCSGTKDLNGRTGQAAALDSRIANPGERINLDLNWMTNDIGGAGAVGGSAFFHVPELDDNLYVGLRGGFGFEGQGALVGVGASWAFSPF